MGSDGKMIWGKMKHRGGKEREKAVKRVVVLFVY